MVCLDSLARSTIIRAITRELSTVLVRHGLWPCRVLQRSEAMLRLHTRRWARPVLWLCTVVLVCSLPGWAAARDLIIGQGTDVSHLDPHYSTSASDVNVF